MYSWGTAPRCRWSRSSACSTAPIPAGWTWASAAPGAPGDPPRLSRLRYALPLGSKSGDPPPRDRRRRSRPGRQLHLRSPARPEAHTVDGVLIPSPPPLERLRHSPRLALARDLLQQPEAITPGYTQQIGDILALLRGEYRSRRAGGPCDARRRCRRGALDPGQQRVERAPRWPATTRCVSPPTTTSARPPSWTPWSAYRAAFRPGAEARTPLHLRVGRRRRRRRRERQARRLAAGYGLWVLGIRSGEGAIPFPTYEEAAAHTWTDRGLGAGRRPHPDPDRRIPTRTWWSSWSGWWR